MTKLKPFQLEGVQAIYNFGGRALLGDEQGLGKTIMAIYWILKLPRHRPAVIVTPNSVKWTWQSEAMHHFGLRIEVLEGKRPKRLMTMPGNIVVLNYDIVHSWLPLLLRAQPAILILDEVQMIKTPEAKRSRACAKLAHFASSVVGLSGTPITNRTYELWAVLNIIRPDIFPDRGIYAWKFCKPKKTRYGWTFRGAVRIPELRRILLRECLIRRRKKDVLPELPDKMRRAVIFRFRGEALREYKHAEEDFLGWLAKKSLVRMKRAKKSPAMLQVGYLLRLVAKHKLEQTKNWLHEFAEAHPGEKLVALTAHRAVINALQAEFGNRCVIIDGRVKGRMRRDAVRQFQTNRRVEFLFGNWIAAGVGLTLHASCNVVSLDFPWTPGALRQGEDRVHRIGQKRKVMVHYLVVQDTIEEKLMRTLQRKDKVLSAIFDGEDVESDLDIFDDLLKEMKGSHAL